MARLKNTVSFNARITLILSFCWIAMTACGKDASSVQPGTIAGDSAIVFMPGFSFTPFTTTINAGQAVIFEFPAEPHNVIFEKKTGAPTDIQATTSRRVSRTFNATGTFPYDCTLHPGMSGTVVVR